MWKPNRTAALVEYRDPWSDDEIYRRRDAQIWDSPCGRGCMVKVHEKQWDYLVLGKAVTQRAGPSMRVLRKLIGVCCDLEQPEDWLQRNALENFYR